MRDSWYRKVLNIQLFILDAGLHDLGFVGAKFTWCIAYLVRIWERLDRTMYTSGWLDLFSGIIMWHLTRVVSDYCPLLLNMRESDFNVPNHLDLNVCDSISLIHLRLCRIA